MQFFPSLKTTILVVSTALLVQAQTPGPAEGARDAKGIPPRVAPTDYQAQAQAGTLTIAAEFTGHGIPTSEGPLTNENFVAVEVALYGAAGATFRINAEHFFLRVNGKKEMLPSQQYGMTLSSLKDPEWIPPEQPEQKSKSSMSAGGQGQGQADSGLPPLPPKVPVAVQRAMAQRVQKAALPEGDRTLPQAGLIFFRLRGKTENLQSVELVYDGLAGKATLNLRP